MEPIRRDCRHSQDDNTAIQEVSQGRCLGKIRLSIWLMELAWGLLAHTRFGPAFFKEGYGDGAQNYIVCFERRQPCIILLTNSDNGELVFRPLLKTIFGDTVTPWE